jgi:hypothetical protein
VSLVYARAMSPDSGIPGWFFALFILFAVLGAGGAIWRVSVARKFARDSGLDPNAAAAITALSHDGLGAAYLASTLRPQPSQPPTPASGPTKTAEQRLTELQALRAKGLVSDSEYETQRQKILGSI